jgi:hypothetical protein
MTHRSPACAAFKFSNRCSQIETAPGKFLKRSCYSGLSEILIAKAEKAIKSISIAQTEHAMTSVQRLHVPID